jgi:hypothetical protein
MHTWVLSPCSPSFWAASAELLGRIDCNAHRLGLTAVGAILSIAKLDQPFVLAGR